MTTKTNTLRTAGSPAKTITLFICTFFYCFPSFAINDALKVKISGNNYSDETVIRFIQGATPQFDGNYDAWKLFSSNPNVPSLYTRIDSASALSINAYPVLDTAYSFPLYTKIPVTGVYSFKSFELGSFAQGVTILMEDLKTAIFYNLRDTATIYSFNLSASTLSTPARFVIHFSPALTTSISNQSSSNAALTIFQQENKIVMKPVNTLAPGKIILSVFNISGTQLFLLEKDLEVAEQFTYAPIASGIYIVSMQCETTVISKKIVFTK